MTSAARSGPAPASGVPNAQARRGGTRRGSGRASGGGDTGLRRCLLRLQFPAPWAPEVPGRRMHGMDGDRAGAAPWGEPHARDFPQGGRISEAPERPVGVPASPAWRGPECNPTCSWGSRGGRRGAQPLTDGTVRAAVGVLQPGTTERGREASVPSAVALTWRGGRPLRRCMRNLGCARALHTGQSIWKGTDRNLGPPGCWVFKGTLEISLGVLCLFSWARPWTPGLDRTQGLKSSRHWQSRESGGMGSDF